MVAHVSIMTLAMSPATSATVGLAVALVVPQRFVAATSTSNGPSFPVQGLPGPPSCH